MLKSGLVLPGRRVVVAGSGPLLIAVAASLVAAGAEVPAVVEAGGYLGYARWPRALAAVPGKVVEGAGYAAALARHFTGGVTQPHRGHLYQVAQRAGLDARLVAAVHWSFAAFGGLCALAFIEVPSVIRPVVPLLVLVPQLAWTAYVVRRARQARLGAW